MGTPDSPNYHRGKELQEAGSTPRAMKQKKDGEMIKAQKRSGEDRQSWEGLSPLRRDTGTRR